MGALGGYFIGFYTWNMVSPWFFKYILSQVTFNHAISSLQEATFAAIFVAGFSPIPFKIFTIAAGVLTLPVLPFFTATILARGLRYFILGGLIFKMGEKAQIWIEKNFETMTYVVSGLLLLSLVLLKFFIRGLSMNFNPNLTGLKNSGIFSLPFCEQDSQLVLLPVPWEVTVSYGGGTSLGPQAIFEASKQLDLHDSLYGDFYKKGIFLRDIPDEILTQSKNLKLKALKIKECLEKGESLNAEEIHWQKEINRACEDLNHKVYKQSKELLSKNKFCGVIGGDHSTPFGLIKALKEKYEFLSILQIDAHMDLRKSYQGYHFSHASIMDNVHRHLKPKSLVQVGIRDFCPQEEQRVRETSNIHSFYDSTISLELSNGKSWKSIIQKILEPVHENVYISLDIDGLSPDLCPNTGTPVPGGLCFSQLETLLHHLSISSKKIVGFDLCEVSPGPKALSMDCWDSNVGARVLFKLAGALLEQKPPLV